MVYSFDTIIDRKNTNSLKYDFAVERGKPERILPFWVADMDFQTPKEVIDALVSSSRHGIFGYTEVKDKYFQVLRSWFLKHFDWNVEPSWLVKSPGIVFAITIAIKAFTNEGDAVMIQKPVYYPFSESVILNKRKLVNNPLINDGGKYKIDLEDFEKKIIENQVKLFILCSPHNPVGRVWTKEELTAIGDICLKHGVLVISDEIHQDFVYSGHKHHVFANVKEEYKDISIIATAPSKTFNLAGLQVSNIFIPNPEVRKTFCREFDRSGFSQLNTMGLVACEAAYEHGEIWLSELNEYLGENLNYIRTFLKERIPQIKLVEPEGTYLVWLDFGELGLSEKELENLVVKKANLWLDRGTMFGEEGIGFQRVNIACPREILAKGFTQLEAAVKSL